MKTLIRNALLVNENHVTRGSLFIDGDRICRDLDGSIAPDEIIDAEGCYVLPGIIDDHVHFREPGLTAKADIETESRAAASGGVTSYMDMPNTVPPTTTLEALEHKFDIAREKSRVNYSFFFGAANDNIHLFSKLDPHRIPGIKLFLNSSEAGILVDKATIVEAVFSHSPVLVMTHCEDTVTINANMRDMQRCKGDDPDVAFHPVIRSAEACYASTLFAVNMAKRHGARLHVAHVSTARELDLFGKDPKITAEVVVGHLLFDESDYARLGTKIKCNPAIKTVADREALRSALRDGRITTIGTDHAPHLLSEKAGGCARAASGMPMIQYSLTAMLDLVDQGVLTIERLVELMCHAPARLFGISERGFLRDGYKADIVIVRPNAPWTLTEDGIRSKCGWSPLLGHTFNWRVEHTFCNGRHVFANGVVDDNVRGEALVFNP